MTSINDNTIGFILKGYPRLSETFILNEILLLERLGFRLHIIAMRNPGETTVHESVKKVRAPVTYIPDYFWPFFFAFLKANLKLWWRNPGRYWSAFSFAVLRSLRQFSSSTIKRFTQAAYLVENHLVPKPEARTNGKSRFEHIATPHLHAHFSHGPTTVAFFAAWLTGKTYSFSAHAKDIYLQEPGFLRDKIARARFVVTCTEFNRKHLQEIAGAKASVFRCYHGLNVYAFDVPLPGRSTATPNILSVGRFVPKKGFMVLIEALHLLREQGFSFHCRLVGSGPLKDELRQRLAALGLQDCVELIAPMPQEELLAYYRNTDLFALACEVQEDGDRDGIPNVLVEAMATAIPVVSTAISGIPELVEDGVNGMLVPPKNAVALAEAMANLLRDPERARRLGLAGRLKVENEFDALRNVEKIGALLREAINGRPPIAAITSADFPRGEGFLPANGGLTTAEAVGELHA
jgi:glycosyltransferase involved in cell wall biosynthesis